MLRTDLRESGWSRTNRKNYCQGAVRNAILGKVLVRPENCSVCGCTPASRTNHDGTIVPGIDAHHRNYNFPLQVVWLCKSCHSTEHQELNLKTHQLIQSIAGRKPVRLLNRVWQEMNSLILCGSPISRETFEKAFWEAASW